jgi:molybdopterin/thiamine biosynthesis adenylyltransferase
MPFIDECFNCMVQKPQEVATCETDGIMREMAQSVAAKSSWKAVELLTGRDIDEKLEMIHNGRGLDVESSGCEVCRGQEFPHLNKRRDVTQVCGSGKYQMEKDFDYESIKSVDLGEKLVENDFLFRMRYEGKELTFFRTGRVIVEAEDVGHAEALVSEIAGI